VGLTYIVRVDSLYFVSHPHDSSAPPFLFPISRRCTASPAAARHTHCHRRSTRAVAAPSPITAWRTRAPLVAGCAPLLLIPAALAGSSSLGSTSCRGGGERCLSGCHYLMGDLSSSIPAYGILHIVNDFLPGDAYPLGQYHDII
jgi:hypothetical protein